MSTERFTPEFKEEAASQAPAASGIVVFPGGQRHGSMSRRQGKLEMSASWAGYALVAGRQGDPGTAH
ncbi:hypothetical protein FOZ76_17640 [Verticiella sediminum]|uniref:Uncharacterized protein n=1 Tax=Verticiella sediminum TaxID=1247510 RepID=A0A556AG63_9BURK|nr:hypothetical protein [Verticiella sediminum]TSH91884.1 hypothetical protein FOZ76_17640 [Verticiella sediminum]